MIFRIIMRMPGSADARLNHRFHIFSTLYFTSGETLVLRFHTQRTLFVWLVNLESTKKSPLSLDRTSSITKYIHTSDDQGYHPEYSRMSLKKEYPESSYVPYIATATSIVLRRKRSC